MAETLTANPLRDTLANHPNLNLIIRGAGIYLTEKKSRKKLPPKLPLKQRMALAAGSLAIAFSAGVGLLPKPTHSSESPQAGSIKPTPEPTKKIAETILFTGDVFKDLIAPALYKNAVEKIRREKQKDPNFEKRTDLELVNKGFGILVLGVGSEKDAQYTDTVLMAWYSISNHKLYLFSIPRDTYAPEIDRFNNQRKSGSTQWNAINTAFPYGGFPLVKEVIEDATGLSADYAIKFTIEGIAQYVDKVFGKVTIHVPQTLEDKGSPTVAPFYIKAGKQEMNGNTLQEYIRRRSAGEVSRNAVQQDVIEQLWDIAARRVKSGDIGLIFRAYQAYQELSSSKNQLIESDSDLSSALNQQHIAFVFENILNVIKSVGASLSQRQSPLPSLSKPEIIRKVFEVGNEPEKPLDWGPGSNIRPHLVTVKGGDSTAKDLTIGYWKKIRDLVKKSLT